MNEQAVSLKTCGYSREEVMEIFGYSKEPRTFAVHCVNGFCKPAAFEAEEAGNNLLWDEFERREEKHGKSN